jgi:hypothetical protein
MNFWIRPTVRKRWGSKLRFRATRDDLSRIFLNIYVNFSSLSRNYQKALHCSSWKDENMGMLGWPFLASIWKSKIIHSRVDRRNLTSSPPQNPTWISRFIGLLPTILLKPHGLKTTQIETRFLPPPWRGWPSLVASWLIPFASTPLQGLHHYYTMIRPLHVLRYFPPSWASLIGFSLNITWRVPKFRSKA